jgi:hypothetical protein
MPFDPPEAPRTMVRTFLEKLLIENNESLQSVVDAFEPLIRQTIEGLTALDYGEVQAIFDPGDKKGAKDGTRPYTLRKQRMTALGFADRLIANKCGGKWKGPAIRTVAEAYGEKAATFRKWKNSPRLGKTPDGLMKSFREHISTKREWDEAQVLAELKAAGEIYKQEKKHAHQLKK